jgi:hypothetical protein
MEDLREVPLFTRRQFLIMKTMTETGCAWFLAAEAVATTVLESIFKPDYMDQQKAWSDWEKEYPPARRGANKKEGV